jgi:glycosyltransferase involved in cell wall biosynthesis
VALPVGAARLVIPCFNEAARLDAREIASLVAGGIACLLVDDGSTDGTLRHLQDLEAAYPEAVAVLALSHNAGKAEAVRRGLRASLGYGVVGYADADFATDAAELLRLLAEFPAQADVLIGARVQLLGREIQRSPWRHYSGRLFATGASLALGIAVYDTQCGAKFFRPTAGLATALAEPFLSRWAFDVELLGRLRAQGATMAELPLQRWHHRAGSKITLPQMLRATLDLAPIAWRLRRGQAKPKQRR